MPCIDFLTTSSLISLTLLQAAAEGYDLVLSSGFLAFAAHSGFLEAVTEAALPIHSVMGTSSGALSGSLFCAGYSPAEVRGRLEHLI